MFSAFDIESLQIILKLKSIKTIKIPSGNYKQAISSNNIKVKKECNIINGYE